MLPFDRKPWARPVAATVVVLSLIGAVLAFFYLRQIKHLDPPMIVLILLLLLAIVPPNILILRRRNADSAAGHPPRSSAYASRHVGR